MADEPLNLDETGEWAGLWWDPRNPDTKVHGMLHYNPEDGLLLSLIGAFESHVDSYPVPGIGLGSGAPRTWEVLHGVAERREITLFDCHPAPGGTPAWFSRVRSPLKHNLKAFSGVVGAHVDSEDDTTFTAAEVSIEDIGVWADSSPFDSTIGFSDGRPNGTGSVSVKPVESASATVDDGTEFSLHHWYTLPFYDARKGETIARMCDRAFVRIVPTQALSLREAKDQASLVQDLVSLATHRAAGVNWLRLELVHTHSASAGGDDGTPPVRGYAGVIYGPSALGKHDAEALEPHRALFTCESLPFDEVVPRWCEMHARLQAAINMIMGLRYAPGRYVENNLLTAAGAAEVLHRGLGIEKRPFSTAEFRKMRKAMLDQVPEAHQERLKQMIRNESATLRDRLGELAARPDQQAIGQLMPDVEWWAERTTKARNDLAHEGSTPRHSFEELVAVSEVTTAVVILNVLHELRLPAERQREIVRDNPKLRMAAKLAHEHLVAPNLEPTTERSPKPSNETAGDPTPSAQPEPVSGH